MAATIGARTTTLNTCHLAMLNLPSKVGGRHCRRGQRTIRRHDMTPSGSDPDCKRTRYYPWWLDNLADDVTGEGAAIQGVLHGAETVRRVVLDAREVYENQEIHLTADYGDHGFIEEYTCQIRGEPTSVVATVTRNAAGKAQHLVVNHRPRSSVLLFARVMGEKYAGTPLAKYFVSNPENVPEQVNAVRRRQP